MSAARVAAVLALAVALSGCMDTLVTGLDYHFGPVGTHAGDAPVPWHGIAVAAPTEQPMFQGDIQHTGWFPNATVPHQVERAWTVTPWNVGEHSAAKGSAVRVGDTIHAGTDHGQLMAIGLDGVIQWNVTIGGPPRGTHGTPLIHAGVLYIGNYDGYLHARNATTGDALWEIKLGGSVASSPIWYEGRIVVATETAKPSGILHVVHPNGFVVWKDEGIANHPHSSVAIDPERRIAVVGANDGLLYAWSVDDIDAPQRIWEHATQGEIKAPIMVADGAAFFGSWDGGVYRVDLETGERHWRVATPNLVMGGAALHPDAGIVYIGGHDKRLRALDARTGEEIWNYRAEGRFIGQPTVTPNAVLAGSFDRHLYAFDPLDGELLWKHKVPGPVTSAPLVADGLIVFADRSMDHPGGLYALRAAP